MLDVQTVSPQADQLIEDLHPEWGNPDWVEFTPSRWDTERGVLYFCAFCGQEVLDGYYNRRTDQYCCHVEGDYDAILAYNTWLEENSFDMEEEEE